MNRSNFSATYECVFLAYINMIYMHWLRCPNQSRSIPLGPSVNQGRNSCVNIQILRRPDRRSNPQPSALWNRLSYTAQSPSKTKINCRRFALWKFRKGGEFKISTVICNKEKVVFVCSSFIFHMNQVSIHNFCFCRKG